MQKLQHGEIGHALQNPNAAIDIAIGPPFPELVPQQPRTGLVLAGHCAHEPRRFIFKKAHLSREDFRIFDAQTKRLVAVSHHWGKNPYESLDPLGIGNEPRYGMIGEMESLCHITGVPATSHTSHCVHVAQVLMHSTGTMQGALLVLLSLLVLGIRGPKNLFIAGPRDTCTSAASGELCTPGVLALSAFSCALYAGYHGMPSFKIRPAKVSMHGRQLAIDHSGRTMFSVAKKSRIKTMSLRHNLEVSIGDDEEDVRTASCLACLTSLCAGIRVQAAQQQRIKLNPCEH